MTGMTTEGQQAYRLLDWANGGLASRLPEAVSRVDAIALALMDRGGAYASRALSEVQDVGTVLARLSDRAPEGPQPAALAADTIPGQLDFAFNPAQSRDSHGKWTKFGGVGEAVRVMEKEREGFSVSPYTGDSPQHGYMVALDNHTHRYPAEILDNPQKLHKAIDDMLMSERDSFQGKDMYLGGWVEDGKLWLDPSQNIPDRATAEKMGKARGQVGIFDLNTFSTIYTGGTGGGGIIDHQLANPGESPREGARGLLGSAGGGAAGGGGEDRGRDPGGVAALDAALTIGGQVDLAAIGGHHIPGTDYTYRHNWMPYIGPHVSDTHPQWLIDHQKAAARDGQRHAAQAHRSSTAAIGKSIARHRQKPARPPAMAPADRVPSQGAVPPPRARPGTIGDLLSHQDPALASLAAPGMSADAIKAYVDARVSVEVARQTAQITAKQEADVKAALASMHRTQQKAIAAIRKQYAEKTEEDAHSVRTKLVMNTLFNVAGVGVALAGISAGLTPVIAAMAFAIAPLANVIHDYVRSL